MDAKIDQTTRFQGDSCDNDKEPSVLVGVAGKTKFSYQAGCLEDLQAMLKEHGDWMTLGSTYEQKDPKEGAVDAWARSPSNPVGVWYGLKKGFHGRFAGYVPPLMEHLGLDEVELKPHIYLQFDGFENVCRHSKIIGASLSCRPKRWPAIASLRAPVPA